MTSPNHIVDTMCHFYFIGVEMCHRAGVLPPGPSVIRGYLDGNPVNKRQALHDFLTERRSNSFNDAWPKICTEMMAFIRWVHSVSFIENPLSKNAKEICSLTLLTKENDNEN